jgi:hypothetical protein
MHPKLKRSTSVLRADSQLESHIAQPSGPGVGVSRSWFSSGARISFGRVFLINTCAQRNLLHTSITLVIVKHHI